MAKMGEKKSVGGKPIEASGLDGKNSRVENLGAHQMELVKERARTDERLGWELKGALRNEMEMKSGNGKDHEIWRRSANRLTLG